MTNTSKRIHKVTIKWMVDTDTDPDTSYLGEYSDRPESDYAIDRKHATDCPEQTYNRPTEVIDQLERAIDYLQHSEPDSDFYDGDACDILIEAQENLEECTCDERGDIERNQYRYFNPTNLQDGEPHETVVKYILQDYERMERLQHGDWCYIGIRVEAEVYIPDTRFKNGLIQSITSGGLWGIESDSDKAHLASVENEELAALRTQLRAIGCSTRQISAAFKNTVHEDE